MAKAFEVLLYYKYCQLADPERYAADHRRLCRELGLRGRVLIAAEGINATLSGTREDCRKYREAMEADERTRGIHWKIDEEDGHVFPKLSVKVREEVVTLGLGEEDFSPEELTGVHLSPAQWREMMRRDDVVLLDARNDYEWELGRFEGALLPEVASFRELPEWVRAHRKELEGKKILSYCTGGIRCEKFSGFLVKEGFEEVYQLDGGIVTYGKDEEARGEGFEGECYVFDERVTVPVNRTEGARIISRCVACGEPSARYRNCEFKPCNAQIFLCESCEAENGCYCDATCHGAAILTRAAIVAE
ncbi:MAG: rhodanese-related sulfurtransferase [Verrucomicrobiales bacterium]